MVTVIYHLSLSFLLSNFQLYRLLFFRLHLYVHISLGKCLFQFLFFGFALVQSCYFTIPIYALTYIKVYVHLCAYMYIKGLYGYRIHKNYGTYN